MCKEKRFHCKNCEHLQNPQGGHCYMFSTRPELCRLNTSWSNKQRLAVKRKQFMEMYGCRTGSRFTMFSGGRHTGRTTYVNYWLRAQKAKQKITDTIADYAEQDVKTTNMMMQMNFAEIEMAVMASYMKCHNDCPFIKLLFPPK